LALYNNNNLDEIEIDCYEKILKFFQDKSRSRMDTDLWKTQSLMKIMEVWDRTKNIFLVRNSLILLISLFENLPPDLYNNRGININRLKERDKELLRSQLKKEFMPN